MLWFQFNMSPTDSCIWTLVFHWPCCFGKLCIRRQILAEWWDLRGRLGLVFCQLSTFWFMGVWTLSYSKLLPLWSGSPPCLLHRDGLCPLKLGSKYAYLITIIKRMTNIWGRFCTIELHSQFLLSLISPICSWRDCEFKFFSHIVHS